MRAISDAASNNAEYKLDVVNWLNTEDYSIVCEFADVNEDIIKEKLVRILANKNPVATILALHLKHVIMTQDNVVSFSSDENSSSEDYFDDYEDLTHD